MQGDLTCRKYVILIGLVVECLLLKLVGCRFDTLLDQTQDWNIVPIVSLLGLSIWGWNWRVRFCPSQYSNAAAHHFLRDSGSNAENKFRILWDVTVWDLKPLNKQPNILPLKAYQLFHPVNYLI